MTSYFSVLSRRGLIQGSAATVLGSVAVPCGSRADGSMPQPLATNLVVASRGHWNGLDCLAVELTDASRSCACVKARRAATGPASSPSGRISPMV